MVRAIRIDGIALDDQGEALLDGIEAAHAQLRPERLDPATRRYHFTQFETNEEAIAWLQAQALTFTADFERHVQFGVPGKNAS